MIEFSVNGKPVRYDGATASPLLWVLRDHLGLCGTKYGCGIGACGACTVHIDGRAAKSCLVKVSSIGGRRITTIEGLAPEPGRLHPVQKAWLEEDVPQCGYCQAGQIMAAVDLLARIPEPDDEDIAKEMRNLCRCGTYLRIRRAIHRAAADMAGGG
ncbi:MAG: (2Fe-2S)-binding protein [Lysobacterales bacterium]|jgi:aerobic-type carbon monoxide dehydrogenase small subunit (CoxS/CutS family)